MHKGLVHTDKKVVEPVHYYCKNSKPASLKLIRTMYIERKIKIKATQRNDKFFEPTYT